MKHKMKINKSNKDREKRRGEDMKIRKSKKQKSKYKIITQKCIDR